MKEFFSSMVDKKRREYAQGFVEFALALPILLLVTYGLLETGRMLFIYSSVVNASRQAVRYGSVTGVNDLGLPRYQDCAGMRAAARQVAFLSEFPDSGINIVFDTGPGTTPYATCNGVDIVTLPPGKPETGDRILVSISTSFAPVLSIIPFSPMKVESAGSRTLISEIRIESTPVGGVVTNTFTPTLTATNTATATSTPTRTFTPTNTPTRTNTPIYSFTPSQTSTPSNTPTPTFTPTKTFTPTITFTPTNTGTPTFTPSPTATPMLCYVGHFGLSIAQDKILLTLKNNSAQPITLSEVKIFYDASSPNGQGMYGILSGGEVLWSIDDHNPREGSPVTVVSSEFNFTQTIPAGGELPLKFFFSKNIKVTGSENILISFAENGCLPHETDN